MDLIPLHAPSFDVEDERLVLEALRSTWVSTGGPLVNRFEKDFAQYVGTKHAISVANGTVALELMIRVLAKQKAIETAFDVITPSLTFIATTNAIVWAGGVPVLCEVADRSLNLDASSLIHMIQENYSKTEVAQQTQWVSKSTGRKLLAVMPAHIMGYCCDMRLLERFCHEQNIPILEDAAEALGCFLPDGKHLGTIGIAGGFSFNGNKILTTGGGGMIVTDDDEFARLAKHLSTTAKTDALRFVHDEVGFNFRLVNLLAALGVSQLQKLPQALIKKQKIHAWYKEAFEGTKVKVISEPHCRTNHWLINVQFPEESLRERALKSLNENNIQARPIWTPVHLQPAYKKILGPVAAGRFSKTEQVWKTTLSLPSSPDLTAENVSRIAELVCRAATDDSTSTSASKKFN